MNTFHHVSNLESDLKKTVGTTVKRFKTWEAPIKDLEWQW